MVIVAAVAAVAAVMAAAASTTAMFRFQTRWFFQHKQMMHFFACVFKHRCAGRKE